jgi:hypothetical protein
MLKICRQTRQILVTLPLLDVRSLRICVGCFVGSAGLLGPRILCSLVFLAALSTLRPLFRGDKDIFSARVRLVPSLSGLGGILVSCAWYNDEPALGVMLVHGEQDGLLVYFAAVFGILVGGGRHD